MLLEAAVFTARSALVRRASKRGPAALRLRRPTCRLTRKNELVGVGRFEHFLHQKRSGDKDR